MQFNLKMFLGKQNFYKANVYWQWSILFLHGLSFFYDVNSLAYVNTILKTV